MTRAEFEQLRIESLEQWNDQNRVTLPARRKADRRAEIRDNIEITVYTIAFIAILAIWHLEMAHIL